MPMMLLNVLFVVLPLSISFAEPGHFGWLPPLTAAMFGSFTDHYTGIRNLDGFSG